MAIDKQENMMPRGCRLVDFPQMTDERGCLSFAEGLRQIPFRIERVFWIYDIPEGQSRGSHSHNESAEVLVPMAGEFDIMLSDGKRETVLHLDSPHRGILIPPGVWCELHNIVAGSVCMVMASHAYDASGYTDSYEQYRNEQVVAVRYDSSRKEEWNSFVATSKNGTFLFDRNYMDYHSDRFEDCSLMFYREGRLIALLPANFRRGERCVASHSGLTYGGLVMSAEMTAVRALEVFNCATDWMRTELAAVKLIYKPIPYIYCSAPSEEDRYALFRLGARKVSCSVASAVDNSNRLPMRKLRKRGIDKACKAGVVIERATADDEWKTFWVILDEVLAEKHQSRPVHEIDEMLMLSNRFPDNIQLYVARLDGRIVAGTVIYDSGVVAHVQYIAASDKGRHCGALDLLFDVLLGQSFAGRQFFDFGTSMEQNGPDLNEGLVFQKEGFGARSVVYESYEIDL